MPRAIALFVLAFAIIPTSSAQTPRAEFDVSRSSAARQTPLAALCEPCQMARRSWRTCIVVGSTTMDRLVLSLAGLAGRQVFDRTGLQGNYALTLKFSPPRTRGASSDVPLPDDAPEFFTALQEQLGLKLQAEKTMVPVFLIDQIERPTEN